MDGATRRAGSARSHEQERGAPVKMGKLWPDCDPAGRWRGPCPPCLCISSCSSCSSWMNR